MWIWTKLLDLQVFHLLTSTFIFSAAPPSFTATPPQYVEAKEGGSTLLSCSAQGNPKPMISWLREGEELATNAKYSVRVILDNWHNSHVCLGANIEADFVHRWCQPLSPSVLAVCVGFNTQFSLSYVWCLGAGKNTFFLLFFFFYLTYWPVFLD